ncbi:hypothetical protein ScPMuIL_002771 [Solemya velum]
MRRRQLVTMVVVVFLCWNMLMYYTLVSKTTGHPEGGMSSRLNKLESDILSELEANKQLLDRLKELKGNAVGDKPVEITPVQLGQAELDSSNKDIIPVLMIACDRITVARSLDSLLSYRKFPERFPIIVSQDCGHKATAEVINKYVKEKGIIHIQQPDLTNVNLPWPQRKFQGYYKIARHYKWALNQIFYKFNYTSVIIVEDDLDVSPDFFEYFSATYPILKSDPTLWCVSAWNDNGKGSFVSDEAEKLYRTDFFPGLGWMMLETLWREIGPKWPETFWDDWMRHQDQRKERACIRPEICRTSTFGKKGVSHGLFFEKHLKFIRLNDKFVPFTQKDLSYLLKDNYDRTFIDEVYNCELQKVEEVIAGTKKLPAVRVQYSTKEEFKSLAKKMGIMDDFKAGVPRAAYRGVISFMYKGQRIHLAPPSTWKQYDPSWS